MKVSKFQNHGVKANAFYVYMSPTCLFNHRRFVFIRVNFDNRVQVNKKTQ